MHLHSLLFGLCLRDYFYTVNQKLQNLKLMVSEDDMIYLGHADSALQNAICALMPALKFLAACALR